VSQVYEKVGIYEIFLFFFLTKENFEMKRDPKYINKPKRYQEKKGKP